MSKQREVKELRVRAILQGVAAGLGYIGVIALLLGQVASRLYVI